MSTRVDDLLEKTSRTFALAIPILPEPTRREVGLAYLLFRVADTFEDAFTWPKEQRLQALADFAALLEDPEISRAEALARRWQEDPPTDHEGYRELLGELPLLMEELLALRPGARQHICLETLRTTRGMAGFVDAAPPGENIFVKNVRELRLYCYTVAGIVGELLTELFLLAQPALEASAGRLRGLAAAFGEALQLVNILKDAAVDSAETRSFLPSSVPRREIFELARGDIDNACAYVQTLRSSGADHGIVGFCALPLLLAHRNLELLEEKGPGAKISRGEVLSISTTLAEALATQRPFTVGGREVAAP